MTNFTLWRYLDFWKFQDMLKTNALFFTFRTVFDPNDSCEGVDTKYKQLQRRLEIQSKMMQSKSLYNSNAIMIDNDWSKYQTLEDKKNRILELSNQSNDVYITDISSRELVEKENLEYDLDNIGINCWTLYEDYDHGMSSRFVDYKKDVVAIKSSFNDIIDAFPAVLKHKNMFFYKKIIYHQDYENAIINISRDDENLYHMGKEWETEKEFRFTLALKEFFGEIQYITDSKHSLSPEEIALKCIRSNKTDKGFYVPINLNALNMQIYCPSEETLSKVQNLLNKYGFIVSTAKADLVK